MSQDEYLNLIKDVLSTIQEERGIVIPEKKPQAIPTERVKDVPKTELPLKSLFPKLKIIDPPTSILLLFFHEKERTFLENVTQAITTHFIPAALQACGGEEDFIKLLDHKYLRLILLPHSQVVKFKSFERLHKNATIHTLYAFEFLSILPLAPIDTYTQDTVLKRSLWSTLKSLPLLSQNLPSIKI